MTVITLNRPARLNAISSGIRQGLAEAWQRFEQDNSLKVAVLTGSGEKVLLRRHGSQGGGRRRPPGAAAKFSPCPRRQRFILSKPVIAAVNGVAYAGGWLLAQMCDLCIASENASFAITEAKVGRGVPWATPLIHMLPQRIVMELLLTAVPLSARRAHELGYVNAVVPQDKLRAAAVGNGADHRPQRAADRARRPRAGLSLD